jgi:hypothetical protein
MQITAKNGVSKIRYRYRYRTCMGWRWDSMNWTRVAGRKSPGATGCVATLHFLLYAARIGFLYFLEDFYFFRTIFNTASSASPQIPLCR